MIYIKRRNFPNEIPSLNSMYFILFCCQHIFMYDSCNRSANQRSDDEQPYLSQRCSANQKSRSEASRRFTDVPVKGIPRMWISTSVRPIIRPATLENSALDVTPRIRSTNTKRQNNLYQESDSHGSSQRACLTETVDSKSALCASHEYAQDSCANDATKELCDHVADEVLHFHLTCYQHTEGYGRIDMTSGNISDGVCHCNNGKTEGKSDQHPQACCSDFQEKVSYYK